MLLIVPSACSNGHMSEIQQAQIDLQPEIINFQDVIRRKVGELEPNDKAELEESSFINRRGFSYRYEGDVLANTEPSYPPDVNLWHIVSPILYTKEEYVFNPGAGLYMRSGLTAEPDFMETVPPLLYEWKTRPATAFDLGRVAGILEYLEIKDNSEAEQIHASTRGSRLGSWFLKNRR